MRKTMSFALAALLVAAVVGTWAISHITTAQSETKAPATNNAGLLDPLEMMKKVKDLPVHHILDAI
jgi:hypothetical protein